MCLLEYAQYQSLHIKKCNVLIYEIIIFISTVDSRYITSTDITNFLYNKVIWGSPSFQISSVFYCFCNPDITRFRL